jgi:hypothetical protein
MTLFAWMLILVALLSGAVAGVFIMLVIGVHAGDRASRLADEPSTRLDALTRAVLGVGVRTDCPGGDSGSEEEWPEDALDWSDYPCQ